MGIVKLQLENFQQPKSILQKEKQVLYTESDNIQTTFSTGFKHNDKPVIETKQCMKCQSPTIKGEDSIMDSVNTGFGNNNIITHECPKPTYKTHLYKENHLGEFKSETEKALVRQNLDIYSKQDINKLISDIIIGDFSKSFVTRDEVQVMLEDFVSSSPQSYALYDIPNNLFPL